MFTHKDGISIAKRLVRAEDGLRLDKTFEGSIITSITTVLKHRNKKGLHECVIERVGDDVANYVSRKSSNKEELRFTTFCEDYLNNDL